MILSFFCVPFSIAGGTLATAGLYIVTIWLFQRGEQKWVFSPIFFGWLLFFIGVSLSMIFSEDVLASVSYLRSFWRFGLPFLIFFALINREIDRYLKILLPVALAVCLYGIIQFFTGIDLFSVFDLLREGEAEKFTPYLGVYNAVGPFSHHLTFGGMLLLIFPLFFSTLFFPHFFSFKEKLYWGGGSLIILAALFCTLGRSIWLGTIACIATVLFFRIPKVFLIFSACIVLLVGVGIWQVDKYWSFPPAKDQNPIMYRILTGLTSKGNQDRLYMWKAGWKAIQDHFILGMGPARDKEMTAYYRAIEKQSGHQYQHDASLGIHNIYLQTWVNFGLLGILGYLLWWLGLLYSGFSVWKKSREKTREHVYLVGTIAGLIGSMVGGLFENNFRDGEVQIAIFITMGLLMTLRKKIAPEADQNIPSFLKSFSSPS